MNHSVLIVCLPPNPMLFEGLRPRRDAAQLAASIRSLGACVRVLDLATLEFVSRCVSREVLTLLPAASTSTQIDFSDRALVPLYNAAIMHPVCQAIATIGPDAVVFMTNSRLELHAARTVAEALHPAPEVYAVTKEGLSEVAAGRRAAGELIEAACTFHVQPTIGFEPDQYPALRDETKLRVFEIGSDESTGDSISGLFKILEETSALTRCYGTRAFCIGRSVVGDHLHSLASELLSRGSRLRYAVSAAMADYPTELPEVAVASGCVATSFLVGSGSQRLIDDHFEYRFRMGRAERTVRRLAQSGVHTRVELTYPCPLDDFHTRHETLRFLGRCMPHSAQVVAPRASGRASLGTVWKPAERRRRELARAVERLGVASELTPMDALLACLAGFGGRERQFVNHAGRALVTGDFDALGNLVEQINAAARGQKDAVYWKSFGPDQRMVGN